MLMFIELFLLGIGLAMDAFAVSVCKGLGMRRLNKKQTLIIGLYFGGFQALMPLIGWLLGSQFQKYITSIDHWIAFILLGFIGGKMMIEAIREWNEEETVDVIDAPLLFGMFIWFLIKECDLMNILCFGDSNTWGYKPDKTGRFDENTRWTALLQKKLGPEYHIIEEGLCGRTTVFHDELREGRRGLDMIGVTVEMHDPLDLVIIMLGTNDCKTRYGASASVIAKGLDQVIRKARLNASQHFD